MEPRSCAREGVLGGEGKGRSPPMAEATRTALPLTGGLGAELGVLHS